MALNYGKYFLANIAGFATGLKTAYTGDILNLGNGALLGTSIIADSDFYNQMNHTHFWTHLIVSPLAHLTHVITGYETPPEGIFNIVVNNFVPYITDYAHNFTHPDEVSHMGHSYQNNFYENHI